MIPTLGVSPNAADKTARPERLARVAMLTPDEKKKVHNSRKKTRKYLFVSSRALTRQLTSHTPMDSLVNVGASRRWIG
jgi:hypothetical protein